MRAVIIAAAVAVGGCAGNVVTQPKVNVSVKSDSVCEVTGKWKWSPKDTRGTIREARVFNAKYDRLCRKKR